MPKGSRLNCLFALVCAGALVQTSFAAQNDRIRALFLGDRGHHRPQERAQQLIPVLAKRGIDIDYTEDMARLSADSLAKYDCLIIYANIEKIASDQEAALLSFVADGKGLVPIHCASYCFLNSPKYIELVGAQFRRHGTGEFRTTIAEPDHPIMRGFGGFESWDETYVHHMHNEKDRIVLSYRVDGRGREPWTWVRTHGKGRVFYTAWGHDQRTWGNPGFQNLIERGIRWAVHDDPAKALAFSDQTDFEVPTMTPMRRDVQPFQYVEANIPYYPPSARWATQGEPIKQMQLPLPADESIKHFVVPQGFHVELFASDPDIYKPICMNWDERGRLWIAETVDYPNDKHPDGEGNDQIVICEDNDADGKADKFTVFADKLSIPTSLTFARGGVIVHQPPDTLFLKDTDGDDRADVREVLFSGWSTRDTHAGPSNLQYGLDNWIWGMQGYAGFRAEIGGERHRFTQGFYRFKPDGSKMEFVRATDNNTWGLGFSEEGLVFGSTANRNPSVYMPIPNRFYEAVRGWSVSRLETIADTFLFKPITDKVRQVDQHGGYTAAAGHALYTARVYPKQYWNRTAFVTGATGHLIGTFLLKRTGSDFSSTSPCNLVASDDEWTAPIMAEVGPDGNVWFIDWYNYIVQHNPTPIGYKTGKGSAYETDLRDKTHGRIYRLVFDAARPNHDATSLHQASAAQLVAALKSSNMFWRKHAQRLLVERGEQDVVPGLIALVGDKSVDEIGLNTAAIHALWTMQGLGALDGRNSKALASAVEALRHPCSGVRSTAAQVLPRNAAGVKAILEQGTLNDSDAHVRLQSFLALAEAPTCDEGTQALIAALHDPEIMSDRWIPDALTAAAANYAVPLLTAQQDDQEPGPKAAEVLAVAAEHYARGNPQESIQAVLAKAASAHPSFANAVIPGLAKGWPKDSPVDLDEQTEQLMVGILNKLEPEAKGAMVQLATLLGSTAFQKHATELAQGFLERAGDASLSDQRRAQAARQAIELLRSDDQIVKQVLELVTPRTSPQLAANLVDVLATSESGGVADQLISGLAGFTPSAKQAAIRVLLSRPQWTRSFLTAVQQGQAQLSDLSLDQKQALASYPDRFVARRARTLLERGGGLPDADRAKVLEQLLPLTRQKGDPIKGKEVFVQQCAKCHKHGSEGENVGPDLTGVAVHPKEELLTNIIDPSRNVEGNYRQYAVATNDGRVLTGLLASETRTAIELFDSEGKRHTVLREDIEQLVSSPKSLMPEGFEKQVTPEAIVDLLEFLTQRGKFLPIPLAKYATIASTRGMFYDENATVERLIFPDWSPKEFAGVPFQLVDPQGGRVPNVIMLRGPVGKFPPQMPAQVTLPCNAPIKALHMLSGISGWGAQGPLENGSVSMTVQFHYEDGEVEDHPLHNGEHFADYIRRFDVPGSQFAFGLRGRQVRYLSLQPLKQKTVKEIELLKGPDATAPVVMAMTVELPE